MIFTSYKPSITHPIIDNPKRSILYLQNSYNAVYSYHIKIFASFFPVFYLYPEHLTH